jgi:Protein of unknown function (DUF2630)
MAHDSEQPILHQIHDLVAEEHQLRSTHTGIGLNSAERKRLEDIEQQLDRCWDALRQRRAAEEYGTDGVRTPDSLDDDEYSDDQER